MYWSAGHSIDNCVSQNGTDHEVKRVESATDVLTLCALYPPKVSEGPVRIDCPTIGAYSHLGVFAHWLYRTVVETNEQVYREG